MIFISSSSHASVATNYHRSKVAKLAAGNGNTIVLRKFLQLDAEDDYSDYIDNEGRSFEFHSPVDSSENSGWIWISGYLEDYGEANIIQGEYFVDNIGASGTSIILPSADGYFDSSQETLISQFNANTLKDGCHTIFSSWKRHTRQLG